MTCTQFQKQCADELEKLDCAHGCGIGSEIAQKIRAMPLPEVKREPAGQLYYIRSSFEGRDATTFDYDLASHKGIIKTVPVYEIPPDAAALHKENEQLRQRIAELEPDAKRYQFLKETPTWSIEFVRADGAPMSRADKFAIGFCKNYEDLTAEWSVRFCVDYGLCGESEDDLNMAIDAALKGGAA